jgi:phosphoribosylformimino-5-aminoimidazole carboxamide ribotide isomerase
MKVLPAIDLRRGACVQLVGGELDEEKIHLPDPLEVARRFLTAGFQQLHIVDLDAAAGTGSNAGVVANLLKVKGLTAEVGGGVRDADSIQRLLDLGAARVMVGTRALEEPSWLEEVAFKFPGKLMLAADARGRQVVSRGWTRTLSQDVGALVAGADPLPLAAILVTAVHVEGREGGTDLALMSELVEATRHPLHAAGGIASIDELRQLASAGVAGAVMGMALYTGKLDPAAVAREFS